MRTAKWLSAAVAGKHIAGNGIICLTIPSGGPALATEEKSNNEAIAILVSMLVEDVAHGRTRSIKTSPTSVALQVYWRGMSNKRVCYPRGSFYSFEKFL